MKSQFFAFALFVVSCNTPGFAQNSQSSPSANAGNLPTASSSDPEVSQSIHLTGKVVIDDGTQLPSPAAVKTVCKGQKRTVAHTDPQGTFSFTIGATSDAMGEGFDASTGGNGGLPFGTTPNAVHNRREWRWCGLQAELGGFTSPVVEISSRTDSFHGGDFGSLVLHRIGKVEGSTGATISATSAGAPDAAVKALTKGYEQEKDDDWDEAEKSLIKATQIYPKYAVAWSELGRVQLAKKDIEAARHSFNQSLQADPHLATGYLGMIEIAAREQKWQEMSDLSNQIIALNTGYFVDAWFYSGLANYNMQKLEAAAKSAQEGLKLDTDHRFPKLEYLLGLVYVDQHNYAAANEHMQKYLRLMTDPKDITEAQRMLNEIARLSATASVSNDSGKN